MTRRQLDMTGKVWLFRPVRHKGRWRGRERVVQLGPKAQAALRPLLKTLELDAAIISPRDAWAWFRTEKRRRRRCKETKQTRDRDARSRSCVKHEFFDVPTYRRLIHRACEKAGTPMWGPTGCGTRAGRASRNRSASRPRASRSGTSTTG